MKENVIIVNALFIDKRNQFVWRIENRFADIKRAKQFVEVLNESPYLRKVEFTEGYKYDYNNLPSNTIKPRACPMRARLSGHYWRKVKGHLRRADRSQGHYRLFCVFREI